MCAILNLKSWLFYVKEGAVGLKHGIFYFTTMTAEIFQNMCIVCSTQGETREGEAEERLASDRFVKPTLFRGNNFHEKRLEQKLI